jgi:hypothetical protein
MTRLERVEMAEAKQMRAARLRSLSGDERLAAEVSFEQDFPNRLFPIFDVQERKR